MKATYNFLKPYKKTRVHDEPDCNHADVKKITNAVLSNNGKDYPTKQIRCDIINGVATYKLTFKRLTVFKDCKVSLTVNGETINVNIQKAMSYR